MSWLRCLCTDCSLPIMIMFHSGFSFARRAFLFLLLSAAGVVGHAQTTLYWDLNGSTAGAGTSPSGTWSTSVANWNTNSAGTGNSFAHWSNGNSIAVFSAGTNATSAYAVTVSGGVTVGKIRVEEGTPTINGGTVTVSGTGEIDVTTGRVATINSTIAGSGFNKTGGGELVLGGNNTFGGAVNVNGGTLTLAHSKALGSSTWSNTVASGATLALRDGISVTEGSFSIAGTGYNGSGALRNISGNNTINTQIALSGNSTWVADAGTLTVAGANQLGNKVLTLDGAGGFVFNQSLNNTGGLVINGPGDRTFNGPQLNSSGDIVVSGSGNTVFNTTINASARTFVQNGTGTTTFSGSSTNYFNSVNITGGEVILDNTSGYAIQTNGSVNIDGATVTFGGDNQVANWMDVTLGDGAVLNLNGTVQTIDKLTITGNSIIDFGADDSSFSVESLLLTDDAVLTVVNWYNAIDNAFIAKLDPGSSSLAKIIFAGAGDASWDPYDKTITPGAPSPVPEPSTYGMIFVGAALGLVLWRRRRAARG